MSRAQDAICRESSQRDELGFSRFDKKCIATNIEYKMYTERASPMYLDKGTRIRSVISVGSNRITRGLVLIFHESSNRAVNCTEFFLSFLNRLTTNLRHARLKHMYLHCQLYLIQYFQKSCKISFIKCTSYKSRKHIQRV